MLTTNDASARRAKRQVHDYMFPKKEQSHITENYVATPPALFIIDEANNHWALGYAHLPPEAGAPKGEFAFCVLRNGQRTGFFASRIERRFGKIRIFTRSGFLNWTGTTFL